MIMGLGIEMVDIERFKFLVDADTPTADPELSLELFLEQEVDYCRSKSSSAQHFAARFAAKKAAFKAMGLLPPHVSWRDIEIVNLPSGEPIIVLHGQLLSDLRLQGFGAFHLSMSHSRNLAVSLVVVTSE